MNIDCDGFLNLMNNNGELKDDMNIPEGDLGDEMREKFKNQEKVVVSKKN